MTDVLTQAALEWQCRLDTQVARSAAATIEALTSAGAAAAMTFLAACESPIERQFALGFFLIEGWSAVPTGRKSIRVQSPNEDWGFRVIPQCKFESHRTPERPVIGRVDFVLEAEVATGSFYKLGVELDGHEWHERSKEQATRDRERERRLLSDSGLNALIRFSGSEVFRDPASAATDAINVLTNQWAMFAWLVKNGNKKGDAST